MTIAKAAGKEVSQVPPKRRRILRGEIPEADRNQTSSRIARREKDVCRQNWLYNLWA